MGMYQSFYNSMLSAARSGIGATVAAMPQSEAPVSTEPTQTPEVDQAPPTDSVPEAAPQPTAAETSYSNQVTAYSNQQQAFQSRKAILQGHADALKREGLISNKRYKELSRNIGGATT